MTSSVLTVRMNDAKKEKMKRALDREGLNFSSFVNNQADLLIENNGLDFVKRPDDGKTPQEKMIERMSKPENKEKLRIFFDQQKKLCSKRPLSKFDYMTSAEIAMDRAKKKGWI